MPEAPFPPAAPSAPADAPAARRRPDCIRREPHPAENPPIRQGHRTEPTEENRATGAEAQTRRPRAARDQGVQ
ncbi:hypothetical protein Slala02_64830 [Streptomyces lavendulae subsp. lavendulae]|nr:hypothetical protein Slala01_68450 [Streptomyces lavendulae subsp. lavendulae]GLX30663.1 hypothetical protein Slala02_64830 [Streptomyces lavendulae subsp. lavendulae]